MASDKFTSTQDEIDRSRWQGVGWTGETPGGGNADGDGDTDPIESLHKHGNKIVGPESFVKGSNSR